MKLLVQPKRMFSTVSVFFLVMYFYWMEILGAISGNFPVQGIMILLATLSAALLLLFHSIPKLKSISLILFLLAVVILFRNQAIENGKYFMAFIPLCLIFTTIVLGGNDKWLLRAIKMIVYLGIGHVLATLFFLMFPNAYSNIVYIWGYYPEGTLYGARGYVAALTNHASSNGIVCVAEVLILGCLLFSDKTRKVFKKNTTVVLFGFSIIALLLTTKRAHLIFGIAALFITYYLTANSKFKFLKTILIIVSATAVLCILSSFIPAVITTINRFFGQEDMMNGRTELWEIAKTIFLNHKILGVGWYGMNFVYLNELNLTYLNCHNVYIQLLAETGITGFTIFIGAFIIFFTTTLRAMKTGANDIIPIHWISLTISFSIQLFVLMYNFTGNCLYDFTMVLYFLSIAMMYSTSNYLYKIQIRRPLPDKILENQK